MAVKQPIGQKRLTNIAVVRYRKKGFKFEIACYKNKLISWRTRVEKDIDEVVQTHTIFSNVGKGTLAKSKELIEVFGTDDEDVVCREILDKGEFQVSEKEREAQASNQFRDIASIVMEKTINTQTQRPYTMGMIEKFIKDVHFSVDPHKSSKSQALELIRELEKRFPISRAKMELRLTVPISHQTILKAKLKEWDAAVRSEETSANQYASIFQVEPGKYRACDALAQETKGKLEVVSMSVQMEGDSTFDSYDEPSDSHRTRISTDQTSILGSTTTPLETISQRLAALKPVTDANVLMGSLAGKQTKDTGSVKQWKCTTCNAGFGSASEHREHFKSEWHKHNLQRKMKNLPPLGMTQWLEDAEIEEPKNDMNEYCR